MTEAVIVLAAAAAAAYLLHPLVRVRIGRRLLGLVLPVLFLAGGAAQSHAQEAGVSIGLLLIAVDAQRDHLRVSEAMRLVNPGPARNLDLTIKLPPGAVLLTFHRGLDAPRAVPGGFRDRLKLGRGALDVIYSYAVPAGRAQELTRAFPMPVRRLEIVLTGRGAHLSASRGRAVGALAVGSDRLPRWEVRELGAGQSVTLMLRGLPVSRPWLPPAAAAIFAAVLAGGLAAGARTRPGAAPG